MLIYYVYSHDRDFVPIHTAEVISSLEKNGHEVEVFTCVSKEAARKWLRFEGVKVHNIPSWNLRYVSEILLTAVMLPYLVFRSLIRRPDIYYTRHAGSSMAALFCARMFKRPGFCEVNDIDPDRHRMTGASRFKLAWVEFFHFVNYHLADYLLPVTEPIADWIRETYGLKKTRVEVVTNGVNEKRFCPRPKEAAREKYEIPEESKVVLALGSLFPWAGIELLISAVPAILEKHPESLFVIGSGEEPYLSRIKGLVEQEGLSHRFRFCGFIPWDEASWFIGASDICIAPFILEQPRVGLSSLRVFSYLSCGRAVVGSDIRGLGDMLEKEEVGLSFPMGNAPAFAAAVIRLLDDPGLTDEMGAKARALVERKYTWTRITGQLESLFEEGLSQKGQGK